MKLWIWTALGLSLAATALAAQDSQPYRVEVQSTGSGAIDATLKATSQLAALRTTAPVDPLGLIARAQGDVDRLTRLRGAFLDDSAALRRDHDWLGCDGPIRDTAVQSRACAHATIRCARRAT